MSDFAARPTAQLPPSLAHTGRRCRRRLAAAWVLAHLFSSKPCPSSGLSGIALGALTTLPIALVCGSQAGHLLDYARLSLFHPLAILLAAGGGSWLLRVKHTRKPSLRTLGEGLGLIAGSLLLASAARHGFTEWLTTGDPWLATVTEMQPLFAPDFFEFSSWKRVWRLLGLGVFILPVCILHLARTTTEPREKLVWLACIGCLLLVLLQNRFGWTLAPIMAVVIGASLSRWTRWAPLIGLCLTARSPEELEAAYVAPKTRQNRSPWVFETYRWIARGTQSVEASAPAWGIAGTWRHGHWINVLGQRPSSIGNFGTYAGGADRYLFTQGMLSNPARDLLQFMDENRLRYLFVAADDFTSKSAPLDRLRFGGSAGAGMSSVEGLSPVYAASRPDSLISPTLPGAWVFERVEGAQLQGQGAPGSPVELLLPMDWLGQWHLWRTDTQVDNTGKWQLNVPVWTSAKSLPSQDEAWLKVGDNAAIPIEISEAAVRAGSVIPVQITP